MSPSPDPRDRLLLASEELFAERGYDGVTVREICDRAGMNGAAVNYHFGDKESLYIAAVSNAHATGHSHIERVEPGGTPVERLRATIAGIVAEMLAPVRPSALQLLLRELGQPSEATRAVVESFIRPTADRLGQALADLRPQWGDDRKWLVAYSIVGQCLFYRQNRTVIEMLHGPAWVRSLDAPRIADHITHFTLAALGLAPALTPEGRS